MASDSETPNAAPTPPPEATPTEPNPGKSFGGLGLFNLARGAKLVALLLFMLPWVTISCADQTLATMSGYDLATGSVTVHNPMGGGTVSPPSSGNEQPDVPVLVAAVLIVLGLALTFVLKRGQAALAAMASCALAAALICYTVFVKVPGRARSDTSAGTGGDGSAMLNEQQIAEMIRVNVEIGFWLTLGALVLAIVLNWMARSRET